MHRCLNILEIQHAICLELNHELNIRGKATLARLARTCRTLSAIALDVLWTKLDSFVYLIRCLPRDLWKIERVHKRMIFLRPMSLKDWGIFFSYSSRVRVLSQSFQFTYQTQCSSLDDDVIFTLSNPPTFGPLIPYMWELGWDAPDKKHVPLLRLLLTPSLVALSLSSCALRFPEVSILTSIGTVCPSLRSLHITWSKHVDNTLDARSEKILSEALLQLHLLEVLSCPASNEAIIVHLSRLPIVNLTLELPHDIQLEKVKTHIMAPAFASLNSLTLHAGSLSTLTSLLESVRFKPTQASFVVASTPNPVVLHQFFLALVSACDPEELLHVTLTTPSVPQRGTPSQLAMLTMPTFHPLLALPNVERFEFDVPCNMALDNDAIVSMARHWPNLTTLLINADSGWGMPSRVTYHALITLLERCTSLDQFALAIDFSDVDHWHSFSERFVTVRPGGGVSNRACRRANFVTSHIDFPASVAMFLSDVCPKLTTITSSWASRRLATDVNQGEASELQDNWAEVDRLVPAFAFARQQGMHWGKQKAEKSIGPA